MINDAAVGFDPASARARVGTFVLVASPVLRALRIDDTFRLAVRRRAHKRFLARAHGLVVHGATQAVRSAGRGRARITHGRFCLRFWLQGANDKRITDVTGLTGTCRDVIDDGTLRPHAAHTRTRVRALIANACLIRGTVSAENAFRLTTFVWITVIIIDTYAGTCVISLLADCVGAARRGLARIYRFLWKANDVLIYTNFIQLII